MRKNEVIANDQRNQASNQPSGLSKDALRELIRSELARALAEYGPVLARIAAADTTRTTEKPETVLTRAVKEGRQAASIMRVVLAEKGGDDE